MRIALDEATSNPDLTHLIQAAARNGLPLGVYQGLGGTPVVPDDSGGWFPCRCPCHFPGLRNTSGDGAASPVESCPSPFWCLRQKIPPIAQPHFA